MPYGHGNEKAGHVVQLLTGRGQKLSKVTWSYPTDRYWVISRPEYAQTLTKKPKLDQVGSGWEAVQHWVEMGKSESEFRDATLDNQLPGNKAG